MKKSKYIINFLLVAIFIMVIMLIMCNINARKIKVSKDLESYSKYQRNLYLSPDYVDSLVVFPDEINKNKMQVNDYFVIEITQAFKNVGFNIVLDITYSKEDYINEIQRLKKWERQYNYNGNQGKIGLLYDNINFEKPAYVASYNCYLAYEYALTLEGNRLLYVYISRMRNDETDLPEGYLPKKYFSKNSSMDGFSYSVYHNRYMWLYNNSI